MRTRRRKSGRVEAQSHTDIERNLALPPSAIQVLFVLLPNSLTLDWAGPAEVLRSANSVLQGMGQPPRFAVGFVGPEDQPVTSVGVRLADVAPLPDLSPAKLAQPTWVVLVGEPGECMQTGTPAALATLHWLRGLRLHPGGLELITVCAGAVLAAHAGLLTGRDATTHHQHLDELRQADPTCRVQSNRVFVTDGPVCSSAGVTTGIDLMLHRVSAVCGPGGGGQGGTSAGGGACAVVRTMPSCHRFWPIATTCTRRYTRCKMPSARPPDMTGR
jgi:transcriptional regulator GlxA family with amidase domain